jgi:hypothetical protein
VAENVTAAPSGFLFLIVRAEEGGAPLAVRRLPPGPFPLAFEIGPEDSMMPGQPLQGRVRLQARLDADGDPMTRDGNDLVADLNRPVAVPASGIELVLAPARVS